MEAGDELDKLIATRIFGLDMSTAESHDWKREDDGEIDMFGLDGDRHNGPMCKRCDYCFCIHCEGEAGYTAEPCTPSALSYSTAIFAAWLVVEEMRKRGYRLLLHDDLIGPMRHVMFVGNGHAYTAYTETDELGICLAALKALA